MTKFTNKPFEQELAIIAIHSRRSIDLMRPAAEDVLIDDIAAALSKLNRFTGHTTRTYTVAEHLLLGLDYVLPQHRFAWFAHDFSEAYLGDVSGPLKRLGDMGLYRELEMRWSTAIYTRFGVSSKGHRHVHEIDQRMLATEQRDLQGRPPLSTDKYKPFQMHIGATETSARQLQERFIATFYELAAKTEGAIR